MIPINTSCQAAIHFRLDDAIYNNNLRVRLSINLSLFPLRNILAQYKNAVNWPIKTVINALSENIKTALSFLELR